MTHPGINLSECFACAANNPDRPCKIHGPRPDKTTGGIDYASPHIGEAYDESWNRSPTELGTYFESDAAW